MDILTVVDHHGHLVVDSRLVASELEVQHKNFLETLVKYIDIIQEAFGPVAFETREFKTKQGNASTEKWAWLTEDQATLVMTFSRNTPKVVRCKVALVKGFSEAKKRLELKQSQQLPQTTTSLVPPKPALPPNSFMSAELSPDDGVYQVFKEAGKREITRKFLMD